MHTCKINDLLNLPLIMLLSIKSMTFIYVSTLITLMLFSQKVRGPQTTHVVWQDNLVPAGNILVTAALVQKKSTH